MKKFFLAAIALAALVAAFHACPAWGQVRYELTNITTYFPYIAVWGADSDSDGVVAVANGRKDTPDIGRIYILRKGGEGWAVSRVFRPGGFDDYRGVVIMGQKVFYLAYVGGHDFAWGEYDLHTGAENHAVVQTSDFEAILVRGGSQPWLGANGWFRTIAGPPDSVAVPRPVALFKNDTSFLAVGKKDVLWRVGEVETRFSLFDRAKFPSVQTGTEVTSVTVGPSGPYLGTTSGVLFYLPPVGPPNPKESYWEKVPVGGNTVSYILGEGLHVADARRSNGGGRAFLLPNPEGSDEVEFFSGGVVEVFFASACAKFYLTTPNELGAPTQIWHLGRVDMGLPVYIHPVNARGFELAQNYPNPFNPTTTIRFNLARPSQVTLTIFDLLGRQVDVLASGWRPAGKHQVTWDGHDDAGAIVASGIYFYRLEANGLIQTRKLTLLH